MRVNTLYVYTVHKGQQSKRKQRESRGSLSDGGERGAAKRLRQLLARCIHHPKHTLLCKLPLKYFSELPKATYEYCK